MKKLLTLLFVVGIYTSASAQIPNPGFETWDTSTLGPIFYEPVGWDNLDSVTHLLSLYSCQQGTATSTPMPAAGSGYLILKSLSTGSGIIPGIAVSGRLNYITPYGAKSGFPLATRPANLTGKWQYTPATGDTGFVVIFLSKWNATTVRRDTVAYRKYNIAGPISSWTAFTIPIPYYVTTAPDSAIIAFSSSKAGAGVSAANSTLMVDTLGFTGTVGAVITLGTVEMNNETAPEISVYPNPAKDVANVSFTSNTAGNVKITLCDLGGRTIRDKNIQSVNGHNSVAIDISGLPGGVYFIKVTDDQFTSVKKLIIE